jgi:hypothetical protein
MSAAVGFVDYPITKNPDLDTAFMANTAKRLLADIRELAAAGATSWRPCCRQFDDPQRFGAE